MTDVQLGVPCVPPSPMMPWMSPRSTSSCSRAVAPRTMTSEASCRVGFCSTASIVVPAASATCSRVSSGSTDGGSITPMSTKSTEPPSPSTCSRRYSASAPLVSSVAMMANRAGSAHSNSLQNDPGKVFRIFELTTQVPTEKEPSREGNADYEGRSSINAAIHLRPRL